MPKNIEDVYPLSPIQQGLLYEQLRRPGTGVYVEQLSLTFAGDLDVELFRQAWQVVVARHPILRTSFHWHDAGTPLQVVHAHAELPVDVSDWRGQPRDAQDQRYHKWLAQERIEGFDLGRAPLMRATLVRIDDKTWTFAWRFSHLLMDGWSFGLAIQDFFGCYRALHQGRTPDLAPAVPYRAYVGWWRRQQSASAEGFWRNELAGYLPAGSLGWAPEPVATGMGVHDFVHVTLGDLAGPLRELAREHQLTLPTITQAAWILLLSRHLGTDDTVTGVTIAHRPSDLAGAAGVLGPMIVTLPVRTRLDQQERLSTWLRRFQLDQATLREHLSLPLVEIQRLVELPPSMPLLETTVSYENVPMPDLRLDDVGLSLVDAVYDGRTHYPITMVIMPGDDMPLRIMFDLRRYGRKAGRMIADQLRAMLEEFVRRPDARLCELDPRPAAEREAFRAHTSAPLVTIPDGTLHQRFAHWVEQTPDAVAVVSERATLTYRELDQAANRMAHRLRIAGAARDRLVGLCVERSADLVVGILAILKCGAAYVPLDPAHPPERLRLLMQDAALPVVLASAETAQLIDGDATVVIADASPNGTVSNVYSRTTGDDLAYVLYTSGSTGRPKGAKITHAGVLGLMAAAQREFGFQQTDVWTLTHSYAFDYTVWEMWGALLHGGKLVVVPSWATRSATALHDLVRKEGVTVLSQTPAAFEQFAAADSARGGEADLGLRYVFLGADRLDPRTLSQWTRRYELARVCLVNLYGITETSVVSTFHRITADEIAHGPGTPSVIGRPLANQRLYLLDAEGVPVPAGAPGEIHICGPAVGEGYLGRDDLTAQRFVPDVYVPGARMYRTGDLARVRPDGAIEYLGRADGQVKIRGFRIELGEVEAVLRAHPAVRSAVAQVRPGPAGDPVLLAWAVPDGARPAERELQVFLRERLPAYMVPGAVGWIDAIPTTPNGKIDFAALPALRPADREAHARIAPRTEAERALATMVASTLAIDEVGARDDLAELGLHSVLAMRLAANIHLTLGVEIPVTLLMDHPTVERIAEAVTAGGSDR